MNVEAFFARLRRFAAIASLAVVASACTGVPEGLEPVADLDIERYAGRWYEIARLENDFEAGLESITATYTLLDNGRLRVTNRGYDPIVGDWETATGRARMAGEAGEGRLEVSFFGPFWGSYNIVALDRNNYSWALVCGADRDWLWILARRPDLPARTMDRIVREAAVLGFDTDALIYVDHSRSQ